MANIKITWTPYASDPGDVDTIELYHSETLSSEQDFQNALDSSTAGSPVFTSSSITSASEYTHSDVSSGTHYYCLVAKNAGGYNVGADAPTATVPAAGTQSGAVACVAVA